MTTIQRTFKRQGYFYVFLFYLIINVLFVSVECYAQSGSRWQFKNVLNVKKYVTDIKDIEATVFSDAGAWHAYALPERMEDVGSFIGPMLMDMNGQWLANTICRVQVKENGQELKLVKESIVVTSYPGMWAQEFNLNGVEVTQKLIFTSGRTAHIQTVLTNKSAKERSLDISFSGHVLWESTITQAGNSLKFGPKGSKNSFILSFNNPVTVNTQPESYEAFAGKFTIKENEQISFLQSQTYQFEGEAISTPHDFDFVKALSANEKRWNRYLDSFFSDNRRLTAEEKQLAVKSIITLITNWRSAAKDIKHDGVFPSINYQGFFGVWSWDSWKQAVGLVLFHPELAKNNIRSMFDYTDSLGMVADCIYADKRENNWRDTKPPLAAWAVWKIFEKTNDKAFVREMYPLLIKYHRWWYTNRDHDKNGLCEYGSTDGTRIAAAWESGMDNAVRFDRAVMLQNHNGAWSLNQESVDLNAYLYAEKLYLCHLARVIGKKADCTIWKNEADQLLKKINTAFWNFKAGYFHDKFIGATEWIAVDGPEAWIPLWSGLASKEQSAAVRNVMLDSVKFNTYLPLPTLSASHPEFDPLDGYWRGPVWLDQYYFGVIALKRYGYNQEAQYLIDALLNRADGLTTDQPICENYHPLNGECLNARNFSWSAAHLLLLLSIQ